MRAVLTGILRSRVGVALALAVIVVILVGAARLFGDSSSNTGWSPDSSGQSGAEIATTKSYGPDDGVVSAMPTVSPSVAKGAAPPNQVALTFAASWLERTRSADKWLDALRPHCTQQLIDQLKDVEPSSVPASKVTGEVTLVIYSESAAQASIPLDSGRLVLRLVGPSGHWFVDGVDWERT
ncbi:hypothetical protein HDA40_004778 [Hamadaea flava]|uniref:Transmembrane protein n=1 Tax=Hamadaea flava TaxID=1742688 RepID=A0ABV8LF52_9ACTN|nr:hypothetical protein [Hamadaea flava]MCP2326271.1 hypothetical protein [Hamadaea flava]